MATDAKEVAHPETDATIQAKADPDPIAGQEKHTEKNSFNQNYRPRSYSKHYNSNPKDRQNLHYKRHNNYRQRSRSNSFSRGNDYKRSIFSDKRDYKHKSRSNS